jgi:dolichol-phosphate mannosyltransferase
MSNLPLVSICIPVFNEIEGLDSLHARLLSMQSNFSDLAHFEFVFTDNHSTDGTWEYLRELSLVNQDFKVIRFTENVGVQASLLINFLNANGDLIFQLDADLQDPPELFPVFLNYWRMGYKVVYGVRIKRMESRLSQLARRLGYLVIYVLSGSTIPRDAGDFRLIDSEVIELLRQQNAYKPYLRGQIATLGVKQIGIPYERDARLNGSSKFNARKLISMGLNGILSHSIVPLRLASAIGLGTLLVTFVASIYYLIASLANQSRPAGFATLVLLMLFSIGVNGLFLGIIGEYIGRILLTVRPEAIATIEESSNLDLPTNGFRSRNRTIN